MSQTKGAGVGPAAWAMGVVVGGAETAWVRILTGHFTLSRVIPLEHSEADFQSFGLSISLATGERYDCHSNLLAEVTRSGATVLLAVRQIVYATFGQETLRHMLHSSRSEVISSHPVAASSAMASARSDPRPPREQSRDSDPRNDHEDFPGPALVPGRTLRRKTGVSEPSGRGCWASVEQEGGTDEGVSSREGKGSTAKASPRPVVAWRLTGAGLTGAAAG